MKFSDHAAVVTGISDELADQGWSARWKSIIAVTCATEARGIQAGHEAGSTWCTDRALAVRACKAGPGGNKLVECGCTNILISQGCNRIEALLIGAVPEDVGSGITHLMKLWLLPSKNNDEQEA